MSIWRVRQEQWQTTSNHLIKDSWLKNLVGTVFNLLLLQSCVIVPRTWILYQSFRPKNQKKARSNKHRIPNRIQPTSNCAVNAQICQFLKKTQYRSTNLEIPVRSTSRFIPWIWQPIHNHSTNIAAQITTSFPRQIKKRKRTNHSPAIQKNRHNARLFPTVLSESQRTSKIALQIRVPAQNNVPGVVGGKNWVGQSWRCCCVPKHDWIVHDTKTLTIAIQKRCYICSIWRVCVTESLFV